jgi:hypothetical protein
MNLKNSKQLKSKLLEQLRRVPIVEAACQKAGISRQTFYRWKFEDAEFAKEVEKAIEDGRMLVSDLSESQVLSLIRDKNWQAISFWLKHHHPSYKTKIQIEGSLQIPQEELTPEQEEIVKAALKLASLSAKESEDDEENSKNLQRSADKENNQKSNDKENANTAEERKSPDE